jgi:hypothetical protein
MEGAAGGDGRRKKKADFSAHSFTFETGFDDNSESF